MLIKPYKLGSAGAKNLARGLGCLRTGRNISRRDVLNWGDSNPELVHTINSGRAVGSAASKAESLRTMKRHGVPTIEFTHDMQEAQSWVDAGDLVYCRTIDRGHSGNGIVLVSKEKGNNLVKSSVYTKYGKNKHEYRVHVFDGVPINVQKKRRRAETGEDAKYVRNLANGWVFCMENVVAPDAVNQAAIAAVQSLGLVFGAVDVGYRERDNTPLVFEVNTAPGIEGTTVTKYVEAVNKYFDKHAIPKQHKFIKRRIRR